jgi:hypothetical protein
MSSEHLFGDAILLLRRVIMFDEGVNALHVYLINLVSFVKTTRSDSHCLIPKRCVWKLNDISRKDIFRNSSISIRAT